MFLQRSPLPVLLFLCSLLSACATTRETSTGSDPQTARNATQTERDQGSDDPLEPFNRAMYSFNEKLDRYVLKPVAKGYRAVVPSPVRRGVTNFFSNLHDPVIAVNDLLQGKLKGAGTDLGRFVTNTTLGIFGIFDVATHFGLEKRNEDLGQTFGLWGISEGPYLVLPFFGPSNIRDALGFYGDAQLYPPAHMEEQSTAWKLYGTEAVDTRTRLLEAGDILEQAAGEDPYVFVREAYRQRRRGLILDGAEAAPSQLDPSIFEDDRPSPTPKGPAGSPGS